MYNFHLDFTKSVPQRYCPNRREAGALYIQHVANCPMDIGFREVSKGIFEIKVFSESDKKRLENKFVNFEFGERSHQLNIARVPLVLQPKRLFFENPKWITVDRLYNSSLSQAPDEELDNFFFKIWRHHNQDT